MPRKFNEGKKVFLTNGVATTGYRTAKEWGWTLPYLTPYTKINSKWTTDLHDKAKPIEFLEENIGINLCDSGLDNGFLDMTWQAKQPNKK